MRGGGGGGGGGPYGDLLGSESEETSSSLQVWYTLALPGVQSLGCIMHGPSAVLSLKLTESTLCSGVKEENSRLHQKHVNKDCVIVRPQ